MLEIIFVATVISLLARFLFDMDPEETGMIAVPLALVSMLVGFILKVILIVILERMASRQARRRNRGAGGGSLAPGDPGPAPPVPVVVGTPRDQEISARVKQKVGVSDLREWGDKRVIRQRGEKNFIESLYSAGAVKAHCDILAGTPAGLSRSTCSFPMTRMREGMSGEMQGGLRRVLQESEAVRRQRRGVAALLLVLDVKQ